MRSHESPTLRFTDDGDRRIPENRVTIRLKHNLQRKYGITLDEYDALVIDQNGRCAICKRKPTQRLCVDHDHITGRVRGLLCSTCNAGLGEFRDQPELLVEAFSYLTSK